MKQCRFFALCCGLGRFIAFYVKFVQEIGALPHYGLIQLGVTLFSFLL